MSIQEERLKNLEDRVSKLEGVLRTQLKNGHTVDDELVMYEFHVFYSLHEAIWKALDTPGAAMSAIQARRKRDGRTDKALR